MATRQLDRLPAAVRDRFRAKVREFAADPASVAASMTKLVGSPYSRLREGDYRAIIDHDRLRVLVIRVGHRRDVYL